MNNLGVIGKPSDWLIASNVNYENAKETFGINLIDIDIEELISLSNAHKNDELNDFFNSLSFNKDELKKAYSIYLALKDIIKKYNLEGLTVRCFDLLTSLKSTSCLAFGILNQEGIICTCEGDIPSMISMFLLKKHFNKESFQANPSQIDIESNQIIFAHCTLPLNMCNKYKLDTHFESGIGIAIKGELDCKDISIFKISSNLKDYVILEGKIIENLSYTNLCRTQIKIKLNNNEDITYFLKHPYGNHHIIVYGNIKENLNKLLNK